MKILSLVPKDSYYYFHYMEKVTETWRNTVSFSGSNRYHVSESAWGQTSSQATAGMCIHVQIVTTARILNTYFVPDTHYQFYTFYFLSSSSQFRTR